MARNASPSLSLGPTDAAPALSYPEALVEKFWKSMKETSEHRYETPVIDKVIGIDEMEKEEDGDGNACYVYECHCTGSYLLAGGLRKGEAETVNCDSCSKWIHVMMK
ncbi:hypothetical protein GUITHDRAFT_107646 [Guillardia theta CCMP2712]|uniref:DPH-type MB domain-containing protein n=1 Tax=Guillardia theta (strain CCMP2712) TaxID=905079 RepID=L1JDR3_GUITC|nr:hypothetical protein GUITHDRAFT_107646 [Guillardia theta CCMP2712]EKX46442.1 hypothetical protein GUITHDRAFT_107646 [Guillardia theta CCMP2712]|eukprot:XP_005833422.1 hypothetical protein GUITHDRAFT_107646 [Guillardia theta CCMP2712]